MDSITRSKNKLAFRVKNTYGYSKSNPIPENMEKILDDFLDNLFLAGKEVASEITRSISYTKFFQKGKTLTEWIEDASIKLSRLQKSKDYRFENNRNNEITNSDKKLPYTVVRIDNDVYNDVKTIADKYNQKTVPFLNALVKVGLRDVDSKIVEVLKVLAGVG
jgi:hypothetical protein